MKSYPLYINGEDVDGRGWTYVVRASALIGDTENAFNLKRALEVGERADSTEDVVGRVALGGPEHNERALEAARRASRTFRSFPQETRSQIVIEFNKTLAERSDELIEILVAEGHPRRLAQWELSGMLRATDPPTIGWYERHLHQSFDESDGRRLDLIRKPDGVVCVNPPANAAGSNATLGVLAILAGNAIVVKAPRSVPLSVMFVYRDILAPILERHGAPSGTLNLISGSTSDILRSWVTSPLVDDILFFGGSTAGLKLGEDCVKHGKKAILELSGNDGLVVWRDADLDAAARALEECFYGASQICMVPKYAVVHPQVADRFLEVFLDRVQRLRPGYPEDPEVLLSPVLKVDRFFDFLAEARSGGQVLCGGGRVDVDGVPSATGLFLEPTVIRIDGLQRACGLSCVREETFFPMLPIVVPEPAPDGELLDEVIEFLNQNDYGLRNSVWTGDERTARRFVDHLVNGGLLKINDSHIGFTSYLSTHGGTGRTGGPYGELNYVALRTTHLQGIVWGDGDPADQVSLRGAMAE